MRVTTQRILMIHDQLYDTLYNLANRFAVTSDHIYMWRKNNPKPVDSSFLGLHQQAIIRDVV